MSVASSYIHIQKVDTSDASRHFALKLFRIVSLCMCMSNLKKSEAWEFNKGCGLAFGDYLFLGVS